MWLIRGVIGLVLIGLAVFTVPMWFESPFMVVFTIALTVLGLWIMGWVTKFSPQHVRDKDAMQEIEIRQSKWFGLRNRIMGSVALLLGIGSLYAAYDSNWQLGSKALCGIVLFILIGLWYLVKGSKAD
jgi:putative Mn2+ efflux pump MntP